MLVMLPGLICDAAIYAPQTAAFGDSLAVEGYGLCDSIPGMADLVLARTPERFDLFGHSMGGRIALEVWRKAPDRVRRLALVSTGIHPLSPTEPEKRAALQAIGHDHGFAALVDAWLPPMMAEANRADPAIAGVCRDMCLRASQQQFDAQIRALLGRPEVESLLPQITCPALVMTGSQDGWAPPAQHAQMAAAIPGSELVIVEGAGHMIPLEAPEAVNAAIARWLSRPVTN
jgi:pimeloyl-ACP methyl ester carboxylesterase